MPPLPLIISESKLASHFGKVGQRIAASLDREARVQLGADWSIAPVVAGLNGPGCEMTTRNRGLDVFVAPLLLLKDGLWAWIGYREEWDPEAASGRTRRFSFRSAGLTLHFGYKNNLHKPQILRAEWAGFAKWHGADVHGFQAGNAGHPHWQFDALESIERPEAIAQAEVFRAVLQSEAVEFAPRDFSPRAIERPDVRNLVGTQELSRMHFASAAAWWKTAPNNKHAHAPDTEDDIQGWVSRTLSYVCEELERLRY